MVWAQQYGFLFLREILHIQPWVHRHGSVERGQACDGIAAILNSLVEEPFLKVTPRSVCDRYSLLVKKDRSNWRAEDKEFGIAPNHTEIDKALRDFIERFYKAGPATQKATAEIKSKAQDELAQAQDMQNVSLKTFYKTRKRKENTTSEGLPKKVS